MALPIANKFTFGVRSINREHKHSRAHPCALLLANALTHIHICLHMGAHECTHLEETDAPEVANDRGVYTAEQVTPKMGMSGIVSSKSFKLTPRKLRFHGRKHHLRISSVLNLLCANNNLHSSCQSGGEQRDVWCIGACHIMESTKKICIQ